MKINDDLKEKLFTLFIGVISFGTFIPIFLNYLDSQFGINISYGVRIFEVIYFLVPLILLFLFFFLSPLHVAPYKEYREEIEKAIDIDNSPGKAKTAPLKRDLENYENLFFKGDKQNKSKRWHNELTVLMLMLCIPAIFFLFVPTENIFRMIYTYIVVIAGVFGLQLVYLFVKRSSIIHNKKIKSMLVVIIFMQCFLVYIDFMFIWNNQEKIENIKHPFSNKDISSLYYSDEYIQIIEKSQKVLKDYIAINNSFDSTMHVCLDPSFLDSLQNADDRLNNEIIKQIAELNILYNGLKTNNTKMNTDEHFLANSLLKDYGMIDSMYRMDSDTAHDTDLLNRLNAYQDESQKAFNKYKKVVMPKITEADLMDRTGMASRLQLFEKRNDYLKQLNTQFDAFENTYTTHWKNYFQKVYCYAILIGVQIVGLLIFIIVFYWIRLYLKQHYEKSIEEKLDVRDVETKELKENWSGISNVKANLELLLFLFLLLSIPLFKIPDATDISQNKPFMNFFPVMDMLKSNGASNESNTYNNNSKNFTLQINGNGNDTVKGTKPQLDGLIKSIDSAFDITNRNIDDISKNAMRLDGKAQKQLQPAGIKH